MMFLTNLLYWFLWIIFFLLHLNYKFKPQKYSIMSTVLFYTKMSLLVGKKIDFWIEMRSTENLKSGRKHDKRNFQNEFCRT